MPMKSIPYIGIIRDVTVIIKIHESVARDRIIKNEGNCNEEKAAEQFLFPRRLEESA